MKTRILTEGDVRTVLDMNQAVQAVEAAFAAHGRAETLMPPKVYLSLDQHQGDFRAMPAYFGGSAGIKWVNAHPQNPTRHGLPTVMGIFILSDPDSARPLAIMDATYLTAVRTGAAGAVASKHLARGPVKTVGFVGCGVQAHTLWAALRTVYGDFQCLVADAHRPAAEKFAAVCQGQVVEVREAAGCDVLCTATPSRRPVVEAAWVHPGTHVNAMGADAPGKQELDPALLTKAAVFVDDWAQAHHSGEINVPLEKGLYDEHQVAGTLGEVIAGRKPGRTAPDQITIFDSTGLAIQDVALARVVYEAACQKGVGQEVALLGA